MNNGKPINARCNYERIMLLRNDITWIKRGLIGAIGMIVLNIIINLITLT